MGPRDQKEQNGEVRIRSETKHMKDRNAANNLLRCHICLSTTRPMWFIVYSHQRTRADIAIWLTISCILLDPNGLLKHTSSASPNLLKQTLAKQGAVTSFCFNSSRTSSSTHAIGIRSPPRPRRVFKGHEHDFSCLSI